MLDKSSSVMEVYPTSLLLMNIPTSEVETPVVVTSSVSDVSSLVNQYVPPVEYRVYPLGSNVIAPLPVSNTVLMS
jgi:hypothetical protein